jgi:hypothetical protein
MGEVDKVNEINPIKTILKMYCALQESKCMSNRTALRLMVFKKNMLLRRMC